MKREITISKFIAAFAISALIFMSGLWLGEYLNSEREKSIELLQTDHAMNMQGIQLEYELLKEDPCKNFNKTQMNLELWKIGTKLTYLESKLGPRDPNVKMLKENYHLLAIRHWIYMKESAKACNMTYDYILYFYKDSESCPDCEDQGNILTYIHKNYPIFNTYSFDADIDNPAIKTLVEKYKIDNVPSIVFEEETHVGFMPKKDILKMLYPIISKSNYSSESEIKEMTS
jgi:hypothetical protein